jgi:hypothetical protein
MRSVRILLFLLTLCLFMACTEQQRNTQAPNLGKQVTIVSVNFKEKTLIPDTAKTNGNPTNGALAGGTAAYLVGFGPIGIIAGAALGAESEKKSSRDWISRARLYIEVRFQNNNTPDSVHLEIIPEIFDSEGDGLYSAKEQLKPGTVWNIQNVWPFKDYQVVLFSWFTRESSIN